ncbi:MAG: hypothetical protein ACKO8G_06490 [Actinomycetota bacterium]
MAAPRRRSTTLVLGLALVVIASLPAGGLSTAAAAKWPQATGRLNSVLGGCPGAPRGGDFGTVVVTRLPGNLIAVNVRITKGLPETTYVVNITCVGQIGTVATDASGKGVAWLFPPDAWTYNTIVFDVHPSSTNCPTDCAETPRLSLPLL